MKELNGLSEEYRNLQKELGNKREQLNNLYRQKAALENSKQKVSELAILNQKIKSINSEVSKIEPSLLSLRSSYEHISIETDNITNINKNAITQKSLNQKKYKELSALFSIIDSTLSELSSFTGQRIDTTAMVVKNIPKSELTNSKALSEICEKKK